MSEYSQQATKISRKFGGAEKLGEATGRDKSTIHRWCKSTGFSRGLIPSSAVFDVIAAADMLGIELTAEDWRP